VYARGRVESVIFVPDSDAWERRGAPGGLSLLERQIKQLRALGFEAPLLLVAAAGPPEVPPGLAAREVVAVAGAADVTAAMAMACDRLPETFVFLTADRLVDPRVLRALAAGASPMLACGDGERTDGIGRAAAADVRRHGRDLAAHAAVLRVDTLDPYVPELRGTAPPYLFAVRSPADRRRAWSVLLDHVQKRTLDLPGQYFDSPFENALVRLLAPTAITPNQITLLTLVVAGVVALLFLNGWLRTGVLLALVVGVLDGVDGKLARMKLATSKLGELEHIGDFLYENAWYLALGTHLRHATGDPTFWWLALALVACDLADSVLYQLARSRTGRMLDELTPFDAAFRRIAGRRNVYVWIFVAGFFAGQAPAALAGATVWAACTVLVHAVRAVTARPG
jgi:phosphatidylglycerophosphate synthase